MAGVGFYLNGTFCTILRWVRRGARRGRSRGLVVPGRVVRGSKKEGVGIACLGTNGEEGRVAMRDGGFLVLVPKAGPIIVFRDVEGSDQCETETMVHRVLGGRGEKETVTGKKLGRRLLAQKPPLGGE